MKTNISPQSMKEGIIALTKSASWRHFLPVTSRNLRGARLYGRAVQVLCLFGVGLPTRDTLVGSGKQNC